MSDRERFQRIAEVFEGARRRAGAGRDAFLREACGGDGALRAEVARLLEHHEDEDGALASPVVPRAVLDGDGVITSPPPPTAIGRYRIKRLIGAGGMGAVYLADQERPRRAVAVKVIRPGVVTRELIRRFDLESAMLGRLQHPGIAQIYEAGMYDDGSGKRPFFAMEYVDGAPLLEYARGRRLGTRERLELFAPICDAVHHAHQRGVIHRDLKPGNVLVDGAGRPKILDFGVARATDQDVQVTTLRTHAGQLIGTLPYMSPEQVDGRTGDIDVRSDVYALGVLLYELVAERLPYELGDSTLLSAAKVIAEEEPAPLSALGRAYRGDLNTIVLKALQKEPERRYQSASDLAADVRRYLAHEPIVARPATAVYQLRKFARRNRGLVAGMGAAAAVLVAGSVISTVLAVGQARARAEATARSEELEQVAAFQAARLSSLDPLVFGAGLRADMLRQIRGALAAEGTGEEAVEAALAEVRRGIEPVNFTDLALRSLEDNIFDRAAEAVDSQFAAQPLVRAELHQSLAGTMRELGLLEGAMGPQEQALSIRRRLLGDDDPKTLQSIDTLGLLLKKSGRLRQAEPYYRESLRGRRRVLGDSHADTLVSMINMGLLLRSLDDAAGAESLFREAFEGGRRFHGAEHWITLQAANNIGAALEDQRRYDEALGYYELALEGRRRVLGRDDPDTLTSINNMGTLLVKRGMFEEAEPYLEEALRERRRVLGNTHPSTLTSIQNMGVVLRRLGKVDEAEPYYREVLSVRRGTLGDGHPSTLNSVNSMASLLALEGRNEEAAALYGEAVRGRRRALGAAHALTVHSSKNLAEVLIRLGRVAEAERVLLEALEAVRAEHGEADARSVEIAGRLAALPQVRSEE